MNRRAAIATMIAAIAPAGMSVTTAKQWTGCHVFQNGDGDWTVTWTYPGGKEVTRYGYKGEPIPIPERVRRR